MAASSSHLALLASQHHHSEYNRLKFGTHGSPLHYQPLSIDQPDYFNELRSRQEKYAHIQPWWHSKKRDASASVLLGPCGIDKHGVLDLQVKIMAAITESLDSPLQLPTEPPHTQLKTSSTHPINISSIIPFELLPLISSHAVLRSPSEPHISPTVLDIPSSFTLDRLTRSHARQTQPIPHHLPPNILDQPTHGHFHTRSTIADALKAAIDSGLESAGAVSLQAHKLPSEMLPPIPSSSSLSLGVKRKRTLTTLIADSTVSLSLSLAVPAPSAAIPPSKSSKTLNTMVPTTIGASLNSPRWCDDHPFETSTSKAPRARDELEQYDATPASISARTRWSRPRISSRSPPDVPSPSPSFHIFTIGNLFLSSCPGKKVRLQGPVKGRSGVCRDLASDLKRMKELGVGCIVCCLDDEELEFLGAPWPEYEKCAEDTGIDVLRMPTPEGLAPMKPASLDVHLTEVINRYTLHGVPVLVHCRGGVGRAGVVACCWALKLGLCGWVNDALDTGITGSITKGDSNIARKRIVQLVERVIDLVRKRRSVKAVETYEQVQFLVDFVDYLQNQSN